MRGALRRRATEACIRRSAFTTAAGTVTEKKTQLIEGFRQL